MSDLQEKLNIVAAARDLILAENDILKDKVFTITNEIEKLKLQLMHKDELLALHNYYNKLKSNE